MLTNRTPHFLAIMATFATLTTLAACDEAELSSGQCETREASTQHGMRIDAALRRGEWDEETGTLIETDEMVDCATFTITQPDSGWTTNGTTPSSVDLAPGTYEVEVDWQEGGCDYVTAPLVVEHGTDTTQVMLPLCADMSGDWTCDDGNKEWTEHARMVDGCTMELPALGLRGRVNGHVVNDVDFQAVINRNGGQLRGEAFGYLPMSCRRGE